MKQTLMRSTLAVVTCGLVMLPAAHAQVALIAKGTLTGSSAGSNRDLSGLTGTLENGVRADLLGGLGSGLAHLNGDVFLAVPDRGPNAVSYNPLVDDTVSYINRVHTLRMFLAPSATGLPFTINPTLLSTTLLSSPTPLVYGSGAAVNLGSGKPDANNSFHHYFTGRSDNYDPDHSSGDTRDARFDPESIRLSNDGQTFFISDEYGPYIYQFIRANGERIRTFQLPRDFDVAYPKSTGAAETAANTSGRTPNKGLEGLALTPNGRKLVAVLQAATLQDSAQGGAAASLLRLVEIDVESGRVAHEFGYLLTSGSGVSDIVALNNHEFLVDERDGKGLGDGSKAKYKQVFKIDLDNATDIRGLDGKAAAAVAVGKSLFLDIVQVLTANGFTTDQIPAKLEGFAFGEDVKVAGVKTHTLWVANDNDFLQDFSGPGTNPNQFFVFGFTDADLHGSKFIPQKLAPPSIQ